MDKDEQIKALRAEIGGLKAEMRLREKAHKADMAQLKAKYRAAARKRHGISN